MSDIALNAVTLLSAVTAAGPSQSFPLDYKYQNVQQRTLCVSCVAGDTINTEVSVDGGNSWYVYHATVGALNEVVTVNGPFTNLRVNKVGTSGIANVKGIL